MKTLFEHDDNRTDEASTLRVDEVSGRLMFIIHCEYYGREDYAFISRKSARSMIEAINKHIAAGPEINQLDDDDNYIKIFSNADDAVAKGEKHCVCVRNHISTCFLKYGQVGVCIEDARNDLVVPDCEVILRRGDVPVFADMVNKWLSSFVGAEALV